MVALGLFAVAATWALAQSPPLSPAAEASVTVNGATLSVKYSSPSVRGRKIFGPGGLLSKDPTYPVWRAGANAATAFHTDAELTIGGLRVPRGDYTLYVLVSDPDAWQLIVNKQTGQWGLTYNAGQDLGRVPMHMTKPPAPVEHLKYTLTQSGNERVTLALAWENHAGSVPVTLVK